MGYRIDFVPDDGPVMRRGRWYGLPAYRAADNADSVAKGAAAIADFRKGRYALTKVAAGLIPTAGLSDILTTQPAIFSELFTFTRSSTAMITDASGVHQTVAANAPRITYINGYPQLLIEGASTNFVKNNDMTSAVAGVVGSGGAFPTGWSRTPVAGVNVAIAKGTELGLPYIDVRIYGTNTSGAIAFPSLTFVPTTGGGANVAATTEVWTASVYKKVVAAPTPPAASYGLLALAERDSAGALLAQSIGSPSYPATLTRETITKNGGLNASTVSMTVSIVSTLAVGEAIDVTLRFAAPQLEKLQTASSTIITANAAVTRAADLCLFSSKLLALMNRLGVTVVVKGRVRGLVTSGVIVGSNNGDLLRQGFGDPTQIIGITQFSPLLNGLGSSTGTLPNPFGAAFSYGPAYRSFAANGNISTDGNTMALAFSAISLGNAAAGSSPAGYFWLDEIAIYPFRATNAAIVSKASVYV